MLERDPATLREGSALPRGWHVMLFNAPTRQSQLRADGAGYLGFVLPDLGLPRLMMGGRQIQFVSDIALGAHVRRESRQSAPQIKQGRSGRFALVQIEHRIFTGQSDQPAVIECVDYVLREEAPAQPVVAVAPAAPAAAPQGAPEVGPAASRTLVPDERMLFRYSAITDNPHRIHYDLAYATRVEGYPALVVNGSIPTMFLLELFRSVAQREPASLTCRNLAPMYCGHALALQAWADRDAWRLLARDDGGQITFEARAQ